MPRKRKKTNYPRGVMDIEHKHRMRLCRVLLGLQCTLGGCMIWEKYRDAKGYGQVSIGRKAYWTHRVYYALFVGPIPEGHTVHHACGNPGCVNPEHLELATISDNTAEGNRRRKQNDVPTDDIPF